MIREFIDRHYHHFNAAALKDAAQGYVAHLKGGNKMLLAMAGAMSTAELGRSLAEMIRQDKVHMISCTGANLEEDIFNLVAHDHYVRIPGYRNLTPEMEKELELKGLNRVTDTCIPEEQAFRVIEAPMLALWQRAEAKGERYFPHEYLYQLLLEGHISDSYQIDPKDSWMLAAAEKNLPIIVPGWEDSTLGNVFVANVMRGRLKGMSGMKSGLEYMAWLVDAYSEMTMGFKPMDKSKVGDEDDHADVQARIVSPEDAKTTIGFFQIGGGIAGDFPICAVPLIHQDMRRLSPYWSYFCQISDSTTSYGSYSGAIPSEKITWGKLNVDTPMHVIESDATIVAPLIFQYVLES